MQSRGSKDQSSLRNRYLIREILGLVGMGVAMFWSAGKVDWPQAWAALGVMTIWTGATAVVVLHYNPALLAERLERREGEKRWDVTIVALTGLITLIRYIIAGLDQRYGWTDGMPNSVQLAALVFCILGYDFLFVWATAANAFFSRIVRIQTERGHAVVRSGPYRIVRHPAYLGAILYELTISLLLTSWPAFFISCFSATLLIVRTALEDRSLRTELTGYEEYARQVRYRLLPGIW